MCWRPILRILSTFRWLFIVILCRINQKSHFYIVSGRSWQLNVFPDSYSFLQFVLSSFSLTVSCFLVHQHKGFVSLSELKVSKCSDMKNSWQDLWFWAVWIKTDFLKAPNFVFLVLNDLAEDEVVWTCRHFNISFLIWYIFLYLDYLCQWFWYKSISACPSVMLRRR